MAVRERGRRYFSIYIVIVDDAGFVLEIASSDLVEPLYGHYNPE